MKDKFLVKTINRETIRVEGQQVKSAPSPQSPKWFSIFESKLDKRLDNIDKEIIEIKEDVVNIKKEVINVKKDIKVLKRDVSAMKNTPTMKRELNIS